MKYSSRFFLYAPVGVFLVLFAIAAAHWWLAASALSDKLAAMNGREVAPGVTLSFAKRSIGGFPFRLDTQFTDMTIALKTAKSITRWKAEKFAAHALTYGRDETIFEAAGHQTLEWTGAGGEKRALTFAVGSLRASAIVTKGALSRFDFDLVGFGSKAFTAQRLQWHARRTGDRGDVLVRIDGLSAAGCPAQRSYSAAVTQTSALEPLLAGKASWADGIAAWRKKGGAIMWGAPIATERLGDISALARAVCLD